VKDLLVYTADSDALAVCKAILARTRALKIPAIDFSVDRHPGRDPGMIKDGPELMRFRRREYKKVILIWDFHGCGIENSMTSQECIDSISDRLNTSGWKNDSAAVIVIPEIEEWLWHNPNSIRTHFKIEQKEFDNYLEVFSQRHSRDIQKLKKEQPKELLEFIRRQLNKPSSPRDFEQISKIASLTDWENSSSFKSFKLALTSWFT
jgi:hypothetical protein